MAARPIEALRRRLWVDLGLFTLATFALTWLLVGLYIWNADAMTATFGPMKLGAPVFYIAVAAPTIAALLVTAWRYGRSEEHTSELQSLMRISYAVFCLQKKKKKRKNEKAEKSQK